MHTCIFIYCFNLYIYIYIYHSHIFITNFTDTPVYAVDGTMTNETIISAVDHCHCTADVVCPEEL